MSGSRKGRQKPPNQADWRQVAKANRICVYCGRPEGGTDDHIPPENLFGKPRPPDLIKVPACLTCNRSCSKDDEYFRLKVGLNQDVG